MIAKGESAIKAKEAELERNWVEGIQASTDDYLLCDDCRLRAGRALNRLL
jgi:hypothetical protein